MTLEELGVALRREREKRGLAVEDVAGYLKIGARQLRALEDGDAASLPHPAYAKGFIRSYSSYLGFAFDEVSEVLASLDAPSDAAVALSVYTPDETLAPRRNWGKLVLVLLLIALPVGGLYAAWQQGALEFLSRQTRRLAQPAPPLQSADPTEAASKDTSVVGAARNRSAERAKQSAVSAQQVPAQQIPMQQIPAQQAPAQQSDRPAAQGNAPAAPTGPVSGARQQQVGQAGQQAQAGQAAASQGGQAAQAASDAALPGTHKVIITATEECWVHSNADNSDTRQFSLRRGDTFALPFNKSLELKLGNAGGVRLRYNGEELPAPGKLGQVKTMTFPPTR